MAKTPPADPLEVYESVPAVSFHAPNGGYAMGQWAKLEIREWPEMVQQRDDDGNPEFWEAKNPGEEPQPKLVLVVPVYDGVDEDGKKVEKNLWAKRMGKKWPDSLFQQLAKEQKRVREELSDPEYRLGPGDTLAVQYAADDTSKPKVKGNYPKKYKVKIKPGTRPATTEDPLTDSEPAADEDPFATPQSDAKAAGGFGSGAPTAVTEDPFGDATAGEDEPPF